MLRFVAADQRAPTLNAAAPQVHDAIPPDLLRRLRICHEQACQRIRDCKPKADWSWESDNP